MKKYWVIVREKPNNTFNAYPAEEETLRDVIKIATTDRESEGYWVAEQIEYYKPSLTVREEPLFGHHIFQPY